MQTRLGVRAELNDLLEAFHRFRRLDEIYSAVASLAEIHHCLPRLNRRDASRWRSTVKEALNSLGRVESVNSALSENAERMRRVLSVGSSFGVEEIILLLTLRIESHLVEQFLYESEGIASIVRWDDIDARLSSLAKSKEHRQLFRASQDQVQRNWGIPLVSKWLEPI